MCVCVCFFWLLSLIIQIVVGLNVAHKTVHVFLLMFQFCLSQCVVLQFLASDSDSYVVEFSAIFRLASSSSVFYLVLFLKKVVFIYNSLSNIFCLFGKRTDEETSGYILI